MDDDTEEAVPQSATQPSTDAVNTATQVDFLVKQFITDIERIRQQLKEQRAMIKDAYESDINYRDVSNQMKELTKKKKEIQKSLGSHASVKQSQDEIKALASELKEIEKKLSQYLEQYVETYKSRTIEDSNGNLKEIVRVYKLVQRTSS